MKKIIAFTSFLFLFLLAVLPGNVSHAAAAANDAPVITGIKLFAGKEEIKAVKKGDNFTFNFKFADKNFDRVEFTSNTAKTVSFVPYDDQEYSDDTDLQFVNGVATLDKPKFIAWLTRLGQDNSDWASAVESMDIDSIFSFQGLRDIFTDEESGVSSVPLYTTDGNGNYSETSVSFKDFGWKYEKGWHYYNEQGQLVKGWLHDEDGQWYYLNPTTGKITTGWFKWKNQWFLLKSNGAMATGWAVDKGKRYYLNPTTGAMATGWVKNGTKWYYLTKSGAMATGWVKVGTKWYYLNPTTGAMATGWVFYKYQWYYLNSPSGIMATGWVLDNGKWYYLYSDGHMARNTKIGSYKIGKDGAWIH